MIKYPEDMHINEYMEHKLGKKRKKALEEVLRTIGNFDKNKPIVIEDYEIQTFSDIIYKIKDKDNTTFSFISFGLGYGEDNNRYSQNHYLTMQRENSKFIYKYYFGNLIYKQDFLDNFELTEISYPLLENRTLKLKRGKNHSIRLEIEEENKRYVITNHIYTGMHEDNLNEVILLENLGNIIEKAKHIDKLNLENFISTINKEIKIESCYIYFKDQLIASIDFLKDEIKKYRIIEKNSEINTIIYSDEIKRETERRIDNDIIKTEEIFTEENYDKVQSDIKKLMKIM